jgi:hypothetical protein
MNGGLISLDLAKQADEAYELLKKLVADFGELKRHLSNRELKKLLIGYRKAVGVMNLICVQINAQRKVAADLNKELGFNKKFSEILRDLHDRGILERVDAPERWRQIAEDQILTNHVSIQEQVDVAERILQIHREMDHILNSPAMRDFLTTSPIGIRLVKAAYSVRESSLCEHSAIFDYSVLNLDILDDFVREEGFVERERYFLSLLRVIEDNTSELLPILDDAISSL